MPSPPEIRYAFGKIRTIKIFNEINAEYFCASVGDKAISVEITIYLYAENKCGN
jgi:hypothetical protein